MHRPNPLKLIIATTCLAALTTLPGSASPQGGPPERCPPKCELAIQLPGNIGSRPTISSNTVIAGPGGTIGFRPSAKVLIIFNEDTPFIDDRGNPVYHFDARGRGTRRMRVRDDVEGLCAPPGCKYMVVDIRNPNRPPLDPYIIIER